jgi:drug/metabolite transporter (DMT)-like permease
MRQGMAGQGARHMVLGRRKAGVALVFASAMVFSTAGLFTKGVAADAWAVIFWRGLFAAAFSGIWIAWLGGFRSEFVRMGWPGLAVAIVGALGTAAFIPAFKLTTIANVALIYASAPFLAAILAWVWMREKPTRSIVVASAATFAGVVVIVGGSVGGINLTGDFLALFMTLMMSGLIVIYRRYPGTPAAGPTALSSMLLLPAVLWFGDPLAADPDDGRIRPDLCRGVDHAGRGGKAAASPGNSASQRAGGTARTTLGVVGLFGSAECGDGHRWRGDYGRSVWPG